MTVRIGAWHGIHALGRNAGSLHSALQQSQSILNHTESVIGRALKNDICGRIPWEWLEEYDFPNKVVVNGPIEARWGYMAVMQMLHFAGATDTVRGSQTGLYCGTMNNNYGMVGLRNGYRICADENLQYQKPIFDQRIARGFSYVHPMVPVYKIPNNAVANIALDLQLGGNNANYFGEDASAVALQACAEKIASKRVETGLALSSNHLFLNYLDHILSEAQDMVKRDPEQNPQKHPLLIPSEAACAFLLGSEAGLQQIGVRPQATLLSWSQMSFPAPNYTRSLSAKDFSRVIHKALRKADLNLADLDFVISDGIDAGLEQLKSLESMPKGSLVIPTPLTGYPLCAATALNVVLALECLSNNALVASCVPQFRDAGFFLSTGSEKGDYKRAGVLSQSLNGSIQFLILQKD